MKPSRFPTENSTPVPKEVTPADGSAVPLGALAALFYLRRVTVRPLVAPLAVYGATGTETTTGSDEPPLAQLTVDGTVTVVVPELTVTKTFGKAI